jgi:hypothetical protein
MQGIDNREHRNLLDVFQKYEYMLLNVDEIESEEDVRIRKEMAEITVLYNNFKFLLAELEKCTKDYESKKKYTRSILHRSIRKLTTEIQKNIDL